MGVRPYIRPSIYLSVYIYLTTSIDPLIHPSDVYWKFELHNYIHRSIHPLIHHMRTTEVQRAAARDWEGRRYLLLLVTFGEKPGEARPSTSGVVRNGRAARRRRCRVHCIARRRGSRFAAWRERGEAAQSRERERRETGCGCSCPNALAIVIDGGIGLGRKRATELDRPKLGSARSRNGPVFRPRPAR